MHWIIFDLDGTLIESEQIWDEVRRRFVIEQGGRWREEAQRVMMGMRTSEWARYIHDELGVALSPEQIAQSVADRVAQIFSEGVPVLLGADAALERLAGAFRLGIATSSALGPAQTVLAKTSWGRFFEVVVSADSVARGKPAPDVYLRALDLLHADPSRTAAVEDSASGLRSAHGAGLVVIGIPNHTYPRDPAALSLATKIVASLDDLTVSLFENLPKR